MMHFIQEFVNKHLFLAVFVMLSFTLFAGFGFGSYYKETIVYSQIQESMTASNIGFCKLPEQQINMSSLPDIPVQWKQETLS